MIEENVLKNKEFLKRSFYKEVYNQLQQFSRLPCKKAINPLTDTTLKRVAEVHDVSP